jgi:hypothetical protein
MNLPYILKRQKLCTAKIIEEQKNTIMKVLLF